MNIYPVRKIGCAVIRYCIASTLCAVFLSSCSESRSRRYDPQTIYSPGFSEDEFSKIVVGVAESKVREVLVPPLREFTEGSIRYLVYSDIGAYTSLWQKAYYQRWIAIGTNAQVIYVFQRLITTDANPCSPIGGWRSSPDGVRHASSPQ